jgi:hypothetical protein
MPVVKRKVIKRHRSYYFKRWMKMMNMGPLWEIRVYYGPVEEDMYHYFDTD